MTFKQFLAEKTYDIHYGSLGNGITVWNHAEQEHGDYKVIAHIGPDRKITYRENLPPDVVKKIEAILKTNPNISSTQTGKVFNQ